MRAVEMRGRPPATPKQLQASCSGQQPISYIWNSRPVSTSALKEHATGYLQTGRSTCSTSGLCPVGSGQERS